MEQPWIPAAVDQKLERIARLLVQLNEMEATAAETASSYERARQGVLPDRQCPTKASQEGEVEDGPVDEELGLWGNPVSDAQEATN